MSNKGEYFFPSHCWLYSCHYSQHCCRQSLLLGHAAGSCWVCCLPGPLHPFLQSCCSACTLANTSSWTGAGFYICPWWILQGSCCPSPSAFRCLFLCFFLSHRKLLAQYCYASLEGVSSRDKWLFWTTKANVLVACLIIRMQCEYGGLQSKVCSGEENKGKIIQNLRFSRISLIFGIPNIKVFIDHTQ